MVEIQPGKVYCLNCRGEVLTDLEKVKQCHWDCNSEIIRYESDPIAHLNHFGYNFPYDVSLVENKPLKEIGAAISQVVDWAKDKWGLEFQGQYPTDGIGISTLRLKHLARKGFGVLERGFWEAEIYDTGVFQDWINVDISDDMYIIIAGCFNLTAIPSITEIAFKAGGIDLPVHNIEIMYSLSIPYVWFRQPFAILPNNRLVVRIKGKVVQKEYFGLIGVIIANRWENISED